MTRRRPRPARALPVPPAAKLGRARARAGSGTAQRWFTINASSTTTTATAEVILFDEIGWYGVTASDFVGELQTVRSCALDVHINSPGGDVFEAVAIYNALRNHPKPVTIYIDGLAASAASFIAMAGDTIVIERNAQMMIHDAHSVGMGNAADLRALAELLDSASDNIADIYQQRAGGTVKAWRDVMRGERWYTAAEAVKAGLADQVREYTPRTTDKAFSNLARRLLATGRRDAAWDASIRRLTEG